jgi:hypothetical protein
MKIQILSILALALAVGGPARGQDSVVIRTGTNTFAAGGVVAGPNGVQSWSTGSQTEVDQMLKQIEEAVKSSLQQAGGAAAQAQQKALDRLREVMKKQGANAGVRHPYSTGTSFSSTITGGQNLPAVVVTRPMSATTRAEWEEDLRVMDKLLRDQVNEIEGDVARTAMGIQVWLARQTPPPPFYVEGHGAIFSLEVGFPLATAAQPARAEEDKTTGSAWERARSEIKRSVTTNEHGWTSTYSTYRYGHATSSPRFAAPYDSAKVDALVEALLNVLAEARNIRHLTPEESVTVTVAGCDDTGAPVRLTLKVSRADIDRFAEGKLKPEEFRAKAARHIG